jgi:hypothetical protein
MNARSENGDPADAAGPTSADPTEITRALCGAPYLDGRFAREVLSRLLRDRLRPVAPTPGVDLTIVLRHCLTALLYHRIYWALSTVLLAATISVLFIAPAYAPLGGVAAAVLAVQHRIVVKKIVFDRLRRGRFRTDLGAPRPPRRWMEERVESIERAQRGNVTLFSGHRPFVGHGVPVGGWSFALPLLPSTELTNGSGRAIRQFTGTELVAHLRDVLAGTAAGDPRSTLSGLYVQERLFVEGHLSDDHDALLPDRKAPPVLEVGREEITTMTNQVDDSARCYLVAHLRSERSGLATSTFLRFLVDDHMLYAECERTVLPPLHPALRMDERTTRKVGFGDFTDSEVASAFAGWIKPFFAAPFWLLDSFTLLKDLHASRRQSRDALHDLQFDYGTDFSVREFAATGDYANRFQANDAERHFKLIERHTLEALILFLKGHGVNTDELHSRQAAILNQGIIQFDGTNNIGALAVGDQARATQRNNPQKTKATT